MKLEFSRQIFEKYCNIKFQENPSGGSRVVLFGQTDMTKLTVAFRNPANAPKTTQRNQKAAGQCLELSMAALMIKKYGLRGRGLAREYFGRPLHDGHLADVYTILTMTMMMMMIMMIILIIIIIIIIAILLTTWLA
jgi:hypothetical protein